MPRYALIAALLPFVLGMASGCKNGSAAKLPPLPAGTNPTNVSAKVSTDPIDTGASQAAPRGTAPASLPAGETAATLFTGTLEPHRRSTLMPKVGGWVAKVHVREGDTVKRGAPLVTVDPAQYRLTFQQAEAGYEAAKVGLEAATLEYERAKALLKEKAMAQGQFDLVEAKYKGALVQLKAASVQLELARKALRDTTITAPYAGVIVKKHVSEGDNAAAMPPTPLITMEETGTLDLRVQVPASHLQTVSIGDPVVVRFPSGLPDRKARITRIVPTLNPATRTFSIIIELDNSDGKLRAGLFAEVSLTKTTGHREEAKP